MKKTKAKIAAKLKPDLPRDVIELHVEWEKTFEGHAQRYLGVAIRINGEPYDTYVTDPEALTESVLRAGEFFISTCSCGWHGCAGIDYGVVVRHEPGVVIWYEPKSVYGEGDSEKNAQLRPRAYRFEYQQYRTAVIGSLQKLSLAKRRSKNDMLVYHGRDPADFRAPLKELLENPDQIVDAEGTAQERLAAAIELGNINAAQCALVDGADLLYDERGAESNWERALTLHGSSGFMKRRFLRILALHLPCPIPGEARPEWMLDQVIEDGDAELLHQLTLPGAPLPLNDARTVRCKQLLESLRSTSLPKNIVDEKVTITKWSESVRLRRELLEVELKLEALERSVQAARDANASR